MSPLLIGYDDLAVAAILVVLNAVLTWMLDLGLSRIILIAGVRAGRAAPPGRSCAKDRVRARLAGLDRRGSARNVRHGELRNQLAPGASLSTAVIRERAAIEARLALGTNRYTALKPLQRSALRSGMIPIINQMSAAGVITLPGMMTGQILAGMAPVEAAKYQILLLFLLGGGAGLGALAAVYVATWRITDERDRLRLDRLMQR